LNYTRFTVVILLVFSSYQQVSENPQQKSAT